MVEEGETRVPSRIDADADADAVALNGAVALPSLALALMTDTGWHVSFAVSQSVRAPCGAQATPHLVSSHRIAPPSPTPLPSLHHHPTVTDTLDPYYYSATLLFSSTQYKTPLFLATHFCLFHLHSIAATLQ